MGEIRFNGGYLGTNRGTIRLVQIVLGIIISSCLCTRWYSGAGCFGEASILMVWLIIEYGRWDAWFIISTISFAFIFLLFLYDFHHLNNYHGPDKRTNTLARGGDNRNMTMLLLYAVKNNNKIEVFLYD
uniref:Uncharacterized protein n=1 Tax=Acrobeloides nanus TaxID=290746 RepID=A0A914DTC8_9BILA